MGPDGCSSIEGHFGAAYGRRGRGTHLCVPLCPSGPRGHVRCAGGDVVCVWRCRRGGWRLERTTTKLKLVTRLFGRRDGDSGSRCAHLGRRTLFGGSSGLRWWCRWLRERPTIVEPHRTQRGEGALVPTALLLHDPNTRRRRAHNVLLLLLLLCGVRCFESRRRCWCTLGWRRVGRILWRSCGHLWSRKPHMRLKHLFPWWRRLPCFASDGQLCRTVVVEPRAAGETVFGRVWEHQMIVGTVRARPWCALILVKPVVVALARREER
mmetsp:Transcript_10566/g.25657  ORF Transcript_10566/g.25657 Transcript_10566/m.25657 type:complete len:266 (-) Transcript_10566:124-921(-)